MLKCDLHLHTRDDPQDGHGFLSIPHSAEELIDHARSLGFDVLSITLHTKVFWSDRINAYAKKKGILLIPGCEMDIDHMHVLIYNADPNKLDRIVKNIQKENTLAAIGKYKDDSLVIAPHTFYRHQLIRKRLGDVLEQHMKAFDAIEFCHFYYKFLTYNPPAKRLAEKYNLPLIGTGDVHRLYQMGYTFTIIDAKKDAKDVLTAIKKGKVKLVTQSMPLLLFIRHGIFSLIT
ncbi:MAG: PHP-associated domain-containing protein [Nanoarchaeota archaeon]